MERMRVNNPDTLQLEPVFMRTNKPFVSSRLNVLSYEKGSFNKGSVTVSKYPDGTIVLDDGKNRVVQRPLHHPERQSTRAMSFLKKFQSVFADFSRMLFGKAAL